MSKSKSGQMVSYANVPETYRKVREDANAALLLFVPANFDGSIRGTLTAQVWIKYPNDGAGTLKVVGIAWASGADAAAWFYSSAGGYGYDKLTSALQGFSFFGPAGKVLTLSDHGRGSLTQSNLHTVGVEVMSVP